MNTPIATDIPTPLESANVAHQYNAIALCPHRLGFHITPPSGWMNDPNGLVYHQGMYHAFYQYHPYSSQWGPMHWGHVTSADLVNWQRRPVALAPGEEGTCFSGSALSFEGQLALFYTAHQWTKQPNDWQHFVQSQWLATSDDGVHFEKQGVVIDAPPQPHIQDFRDPKVWQDQQGLHMVIGAQSNGRGVVLYYQSNDLTHWQFVSELASATLPQHGYMWECPDLFTLDHSQVLAYSPQGLPKQGHHHLSEYQCGYLCDSGHGFNAEQFIEFDKGHDFYASQTFLSKDGRRLLQAWMGLPATTMPTQKRGWAGALSLPRELTLTNQNTIVQTPARELKALRVCELKCTAAGKPLPARLDSQTITLDIAEELLEVRIRFSLKRRSAERFGLLLRCGEAPFEQTLVAFDAMAHRHLLDRNLSGQVQGVRSVAAYDDNHVEWTIYLDRSAIEIFPTHAEATISSRIYPSPNNLGIKLFAENGEVEIESLKMWRLKDIWVSQQPAR